jgi:hypothetical protein
MPLLPRSRRGTWLLAGAVWLVACAGLWWALPFKPLAEWHFGAQRSILGVSRDHVLVCDCREIPLPTVIHSTKTHRCGPVRLLLFPSGNETKSWLTSDEIIDGYVVSHSGRRIAVFSHTRNRRDGESLWLLDIDSDRQRVRLASSWRERLQCIAIA